MCADSIARVETFFKLLTDNNTDSNTDSNSHNRHNSNITTDN